MKQIAETLLAWRDEGERVAIATVVRVTGSAPRPVGAALIAAREDRIAGSVSNGCVESDAFEVAMEALRSDRPRIVSYGISDEFAFTVGLSCGGAIDVLAEPVSAVHEHAARAIRRGRAVVLARILAPEDRVGSAGARIGADPFTGELAALEDAARAALRDGLPREIALRLADRTEATVLLEPIAASPLLVVVGATDIAMTLATLGQAVGYRVIVADPRTALASRERFPDLAVELVHAWPDDALAGLALDASSAVAVLSHDEKFDQPALIATLRSAAGYIGAIGSRRTNDKRFAWLREQGFTDADIARVHAPIGLDIGARTPEETALAILAEAVAVRRQRDGRSLSARELATAR